MRLFRRPEPRSFVVNEFTVLGVFVAVAVLGILYGMFASVLSPAVGTAYDLAEGRQPVVTAPTSEEYRAEVRDVAGPFLRQAASMTDADVRTANPALLQLVEKTQERLLRVVVPKEHRSTHLTMVLLLDQWKRALNGSTADQDVVLSRTKDLVAANDWLAD